MGDAECEIFEERRSSRAVLHLLFVGVVAAAGGCASSPHVAPEEVEGSVQKLRTEEGLCAGAELAVRTTFKICMFHGRPGTMLDDEKRRLHVHVASDTAKKANTKFWRLRGWRGEREVVHTTLPEATPEYSNATYFSDIYWTPSEEPRQDWAPGEYRFEITSLHDESVTATVTVELTESE